MGLPWVDQVSVAQLGQHEFPLNKGPGWRSDRPRYNLNGNDALLRSAATTTAHQGRSMNRASWDIQQCPLAMRCRSRWERLEPMQGEPAMRFCVACNRVVYLCRTEAEFTRHSALERCVALEVLSVGVAHIDEPLSSRTGYAVPESGNQDADL